VEIVRNVLLSHHYLISYISMVIFISFLIKTVKFPIAIDKKENIILF
jgi:hypothetical protein